MTTNVFPERCYHFLKVRDGMLEPWRWSMYYEHDTPLHVVILNEEAPKSVTFDPAPAQDTIYYQSRATMPHGYYHMVVTNRGEPVTFHSGDAFHPSEFPYILGTNKTAVVMEYKGEVLLNPRAFDADVAFFRVDHFDMTPRVLADHIHADNSYLHGILAFSCDWEGSRTVELWCDGSTKIAKFMNIGSGMHVLEYSIPGNAVRSWSSSGTRMVPLELRATHNGFEKILWSGATLAVKPAVPQG